MNNISRYVGSGQMPSGTIALERVAGFAERHHRRNDLVAHVLRVLDGVAACVRERAGECVGALLEVVGQPDDLGEQLLALSRCGASGLDRANALGHLLLVLESRRQNLPVGHQHHQLAFDVDDLVVGLDHDVVARVAARGR